MTWKACTGIAIATHPFIASGKNQISLLTGDYLVIYDETDNWYHGQNIISESEGIFPKSFVSFTKQKRLNSVSISNYMKQKVDLLRIEAQLTLHFALKFIDHEQDQTKVCDATKYIEELVNQLNLINNDDDDDDNECDVYDVHRKISLYVDELRKLLGITKTFRTKYDEFSTFTSWGQEQFSSSIVPTNKEISEPDYVALHFHVEIDVKKELKELFFTFYLYQSVRLPWISEPVSVKLGPEKSQCDIFFNYLEKKNLQNEVHLVVYIYDYSQQNNSSTKQVNIDRDVVGIGYVRLPSLKADVAFRKGPITLKIEPKASSSSIFMYGGHEYFISGKDSSCNESLRPAFPNMKITFTPYFGQTNAFIDKQVVAYPLVVNSLFLPTVIPAKKTVSKLHVYISGIKEHITRKREIVTARLFDTSDNTFQQAIQNSYLGKKSNYFSTVVFNGIKEKEIHLADSFCFDLSSYPSEKLKDLNILFELKAVGESTGTAFALVPITDSNGFIEQKDKQTVDLYAGHIKNIQKFTANELQTKGKSAAILRFDTILSSTLHSSNKQLLKLINYQQFESELKSILSTFKEIPMYEWCKFFKIISYNLIKIINSNEDCKEVAFDVLLYIFSEILTRGRKDYINQINELIQEHFTSEDNQNEEEDFEDIKGLYENLIPLVTDSIKKDDNKNFRNLLKCSAYFFDMSMKSIIIYNSDAEINLEPVKKKLKGFFKELNDVISKVPEENDELNSGTVFTDQQLILQHFPAMIIALIQCIDPQFLGKTVVSFIRSIRYVKDDKKQLPLDKSRMKILYILSGTKCWENENSRKILQGVYKSELEKAVDLPLCSKFIAPTIGSLFLTYRDDFAVQFIDMLYDLYQKDIESIKDAKGNASKKVAEIDAENIAKVLMLIAYKYPDKIPYNYLLELMRSEHLSPQVRLFIYANFAFSGIEKLKEMLSSDEISNQEKNETITLFFALTVMASEKSDIELENIMNLLIYPKSFDYTTCISLFESLPKEAKVNPDLIEPLFHCYILSNESDELNVLFYRLVEADVNVNKKPTTVLKPTLDAVYKLSKMKNFDKLTSIFNCKKKIKKEEIATFYKQFKDISIALMNYRKMIGNNSLLSTNADKLSEAIDVLINACKYTNHLELMPKCLLRLAQLNLTCGNYLEASKAYEMFLDYIPCNHDNLEEEYRIENAKTGFELHTNVMLKIIGLYMNSNYDEYALNIIDKLCSKVVKPYQYIDLMKTILDKETAVYHNIVTQERKYSNFFYVRFEGKNFDAYYDNNRSFIYRKHPSVDLNSFIREMAVKFQVDSNNISEDEPTNSNDNHIQIFQVYPSFEEEIEDSFYQPETNQMKYLLSFSLYKDATLFKREYDLSSTKSSTQSTGKTKKSKKSSQKVDVSNTELKQFFYRTKEPVPCMRARVEVDMDKVEEKTINPVNKAILIVKRRTAGLKVETYTYKKLLDSNRIDIVDSSVVSLFTNNINTAVNNFDVGDTQQFIQTYIKDNDSDADSKKVDTLKEALRLQMRAIQDALNVNVKIVPKLNSKVIEELKDHTLKQVIVVKKKIRDVLD